MKIKSLKLLTIPQTNVGLTLLDLPLPDESNCGGYRINTDSGIIFAYSPIDITIAALSSSNATNSSVITDLNKWFIKNPSSISELWVTCSILINEETVISNSIAEWKWVSKKNYRFKKIFKTNAPFTFREV